MSFLRLGILRVLFFLCFFKNSISSWNRTKRFDQKPAYFNFDLKKYDDFGVINNQKIFKKYGYKENECSSFNDENYQYIYFMRDYSRNKLRIYLKFENMNDLNIMKITRNIPITFWTWSNMVKFFIMNSNIYVLKRYKNMEVDIAKMNSIYKLSEFYLTLSVCTLVSNKTYHKFLPMYMGRYFPNPCSRERCYFISDTTRYGFCKNYPIPVYDTSYSCDCKENFEFVKEGNKNLCKISHKKALAKFQKLKNCNNNGIVENNECKCKNGYQGPDCSIKIDKLKLKCSNGNCIGETECVVPFMKDTTKNYTNCLKLISNEPFCELECFKGYCINNYW